jgi:hypothetical protein
MALSGARVIDFGTQGILIPGSSANHPPQIQLHCLGVFLAHGDVFLVEPFRQETQ